MNTKEIKSTCRTFLLPFQDECLHIIETGHTLEEKRFLTVREDAYMMKTGESEMLSKKEIKNGYLSLYTQIVGPSCKGAVLG